MGFDVECWMHEDLERLVGNVREAKLMRFSMGVPRVGESVIMPHRPDEKPLELMVYMVKWWPGTNMPALYLRGLTEEERMSR